MSRTRIAVLVVFVAALVAAVVAHSGKDGRFELPSARAGTYTVDAKTESAFASPRDVVVPVTSDMVVELIDFGRVAVRFLAADRAALRGAEFSLVAATVRPGRYDVVVALGGRTQRFPVEVKSGETSVVEVRAP